MAGRIFCHLRNTKNLPIVAHNNSIMTEPDLITRKKRLCTGHQASTTKILGQVQPAIDSEPLDVAKIDQFKRSLEKKMKSLSLLDNEVLTLIPEEAIEDEIVQADEIRERLYTALSRLGNKLNPTAPILRPLPETLARVPTPAVHPAVGPPIVISHDPSDEATLPVRGTNVNLPKISLLRFNGDPVKWTSFWDSYWAAIHLNTELSEIDKFNYLRSLLEHTAYDAIVVSHSLLLTINKS